MSRLQGLWVCWWVGYGEEVKRRRENVEVSSQAAGQKEVLFAEMGKLVQGTRGSSKDPRVRDIGTKCPRVLAFGQEAQQCPN